MSWLGSIFGGSNDTINTAIPQYGNISQYGINQGEKGITQAQNFWSDILSGDQAKIGQVLGPQISNIQQQGQQEKQTLGQFGNRSGGTNAKAQTIGDTTRQNVNNMVSSLTGSAASNLGNNGLNLLNQGTNALSDQVNSSQIQMQNWQKSLFGKGLTSGISSLESFALGKIPGFGS